MTDILTALARSKHMARIRGKDTAPELALRRGLHAAGLRFRLHAKGLPGHPDIVLKKHRAVVFVHGCFWHRHPRCRLAYRPKTRITFWEEKFRNNRKRDLSQQRALTASGWRVLVVWECALRDSKKQTAAVRKTISWLNSDLEHGAIPNTPE